MSHAVYFNYHVRVDLTVKKVEDDFSVTSATYKFVYKSLKESAAVMDYWPLLISVSEITRASGEILPSDSFSGFTILNTIGSFGANRKFADVLERFTPVEQDVAVYIAALDTDVDDVSTEWQQVAKGVCSSYSASISDVTNTLTFNVRPNSVKDKPLTLEVDRTVSGMENAPDSSLGRAVPLVIGEGCQVIPVRISADGASEPRYAWGTCLYEHTKNGASLYKIWTKNYADLWEECTNSLGLYQDTSASASDGTYTLNTYAEQIISVGAGNGTLVTGVDLYCKGNGLATSTARLAVNLYRYDLLTKNVVEQVASGRVELAYYDAFNAASTTSFAVRVMFDRPVHLSSYNNEADFPRYQYALGWTVTGYQVNDLSIHYTTIDLDGFRRDTAGASEGFEWLFVTPLRALKLIFLTTTITITEHVDAYTPAGLTYSKMAVDQVDPTTAQTAPAFEDFPFLITGVNGVSEYGSGDVITAAQDLVEALDYQWNPDTAAWEDSGNWDTTTHAAAYDDLFAAGSSPSYRNRRPVAVFDSRVTFVETLSQLCRGLATRVGVRADGKMFLYPWGREQEEAYNIPPRDITGIEWRQGDISTVVNRASVKTGKSYVTSGYSQENQIAEGRTGFGYDYSNDFNAGGNYPHVTAMTRKSRLLWGDRPAADTEYIVYPQSATGDGGYLAGSDAVDGQGSVIAEYILAKNGLPPVRASMLVQWVKYQELQMFDVVEFAATDFPAFFGTNPEVRDPVFSGASTAASNMIDGHEWVAAQSYRGLVETVGYIFPPGQAPMVRVTVTVLLNFGYDPT